MLNKTMRAMVVLLCYLFLMANEESTASQSMVRACGKHLSEVIGIVCYNRYADQNDQPLSILPKEYISNDVFITAEKAKSLLKMNRQKRQGIVNECCFKSCTLEELKDYCEY